MRLRTTAILATAALGLTVAGVASAAELLIAPIGTGKKTCVLKPGADCRGVVHRWTVEHHGNLRKAKFTKADLRGADFRGADLRGADFRGAKLRHAEFRGANLRGAGFDVVKQPGKTTNGGPVWTPCRRDRCVGADLEFTDFTNANLAYANLTGAFLTYANLTGANLTSADLTGADLSIANLTSANLFNANLQTATLNNATCPNGTKTWNGC